MKTPKQFQIDGAKFLASHGHALLADEMGLGKTFQAILAAKYIRAKSILIVCPASVKLNWQDELIDAGYADVQVILSGAQVLNKSNIVVVNYDILTSEHIRSQLMRKQFDLLICDEAHYLKSASAMRTAHVLGRNSLASVCRHRWLLTGTPMLNRPKELYVILRTLAANRLGRYINYELYAHKFCGAFFDGYGMNDRGASAVQELASMLDGFMLRRTKKEVLPQLPDKIVKVVRLPRTRDYDMIDQAELEICSKDTRESYIRAHFEQLGELATLRRVTGEAKASQVVRHVEGILDSGVKVVVFAHHRFMVEKLKRELNRYNPVVIYGGMRAEDKHAAVHAFKTDGHQVFIGNIQSAGQGIDGLQHVCSRVVFAELAWTPGEMQQAADRCHRLGQHLPVNIDYLVASNTIEEAILKTLFRKENTIAAIIRETKNTRRDESMMVKIERLIDLLIQALEKYIGQQNNLLFTGEGITPEPPKPRKVKTPKENKPAEAPVVPQEPTAPAEPASVAPTVAATPAKTAPDNSEENEIRASLNELIALRVKKTPDGMTLARHMLAELDVTRVSQLNADQRKQFLSNLKLAIAGKYVAQ